jgi:hypothetical protein
VVTVWSTEAPPDGSPTTTSARSRLRISTRERRRGLKPDERYLDALESDPAAREWLRRQYGANNLAERLLQERERGAATN